MPNLIYGKDDRRTKDADEKTNNRLKKTGLQLQARLEKVAKHAFSSIQT